MSFIEIQGLVLRGLINSFVFNAPSLPPWYAATGAFQFVYCTNKPMNKSMHTVFRPSERDDSDTIVFRVCPLGDEISGKLGSWLLLRQ